MWINAKKSYRKNSGDSLSSIDTVIDDEGYGFEGYALFTKIVPAQAQK